MNKMLVLALVLLAAPAVAQEGEWKDQRFEDCKCNAQFPGKPQEKSQTMTTQLGNLESKMIMLEVPNQGFYALAYVDYPKDKLGSTKPDKLLDGARDGAVSKVHGTLAKETKITMNGFPGRELTIDAPGDLTLLARIYLAKERLYQSLVVVKKVNAEAAENRKFLDSFKFDKR